MFGGHGIFHDDLMFALIAWNRLYFKVDDETKERFAAAGGEPFVYRGKRKPVEMSYWALPGDGLGDPAALIDWAELALAAAPPGAGEEAPQTQGLSPFGCVLDEVRQR